MIMTTAFGPLLFLRSQHNENTDFGSERNLIEEEADGAESG